MVDLVITASQVLVSGSPPTVNGKAGATITAGQSVYLDSGTDTYKLAQCDGTAAEIDTVGIALHAALSGQPLAVQTGGTITLGAGAAPTVGLIYVVAATAGGIAPSADLASTNKVTILGVGGATNTLVMKIHNSGQTKP